MCAQPRIVVLGPLGKDAGDVCALGTAKAVVAPPPKPKLSKDKANALLALLGGGGGGLGGGGG